MSKVRLRVLTSYKAPKSVIKTAKKKTDWQESELHGRQKCFLLLLPNHGFPIPLQFFSYRLQCPLQILTVSFIVIHKICFGVPSQ